MLEGNCRCEMEVRLEMEGRAREDGITSMPYFSLLADGGLWEQSWGPKTRIRATPRIL